MTAAALTVPAFTRPGLIEALIGSIVSVIAGIFPPLFAAEAEADDDYSDMDLSDEELAALKDDDDQGGDNNDNGEGDDDDDPDQDDNDGREDEGADSDPDGQADDDQHADSSEDNAGDPEDDADPDGKEEEQENNDIPDSTTDDGRDKQRVVDPEPDSTSDYEEKIKVLDQKLDDGDIEFDDYKKELRAIERDQVQETVRQEMARTKVEETWQSEQQAFFHDNGYLRENPIVFDAYAREVNRLLGDKEWGSKPGSDILAEAKKNIDSAFGIKPGEKSDLPPEKKEKTLGQKAVDNAKKANAEKAAPKTLKDVPAADKNTDGAFDHLDDLDGQELEAAIEKMTPAEREAYENSH